MTAIETIQLLFLAEMFTFSVCSDSGQLGLEFGLLLQERAVTWDKISFHR